MEAEKKRNKLSLEAKRELLAQLKKKRESLDFEIRNLENRIANQERQKSN